jgi:ketosteroid isomerase-like protein
MRSVPPSAPYACTEWDGREGRSFPCGVPAVATDGERYIGLTRSVAEAAWAGLVRVTPGCMYRWIVKQLTRFALARLRRGDPRILLALAADDLHFRFLGKHSWAADYRSKDKVRTWFARYLRSRLELEPHEIVVSGPPWNTVICTRFTDRATDLTGRVIYQNEGVLFDRLRWGRIREHISYEDTQRTLEFDHTLGVETDKQGAAAR